MGGRAERWLWRNPPEARVQAALRGWVGEGELKAGTGRGKRPVGDEVKALFLLSLLLKAEIYSPQFTLPQLRPILHNVNFLFEGLHESSENLERTTSLMIGCILLTEWFFFKLLSLQILTEGINAMNEHLLIYVVNKNVKLLK